MKCPSCGHSENYEANLGTIIGTTLMGAYVGAYCFGRFADRECLACAAIGLVLGCTLSYYGNKKRSGRQQADQGTEE